MAKKTIAAPAAPGKREVRAKLTAHERALLAELIELYGARGAARRLAR